MQPHHADQDDPYRVGRHDFAPHLQLSVLKLSSPIIGWHEAHGEPAPPQVRW